MKKLVVMLLIGSSIAPALAGEPYVGASVGRAQQKMNAETIDLSMSSTSAKLFAGYEFANGFGMEAGYTYFGKASISGGDTTVSVEPKTFYAAVTGRMAISKDFSGYAKLGIARPGTTGRATQGTKVEVFDTRRVTPMLGFGVSYSLDEKIAVFAEYEYYGKAINADEGTLKLDNLSVGLRYKF
ncbi:outer membrane beta-barrel protein [Massilia solisilvae]|uniref:Outer membrane beta-barrel protein n=1 Tax=Massilia solisilvae TaxID=1811225 RepID=A0ABT2BLU7_9BURK|nr:outer membrane beta-barrel protein [Massilia solisilvae]MCS0609488.1 outer membrane beta-barrel protein [Massilia solisilvae]